MIPEKPRDGNWLAWANACYPFDPAWERYLIERTERPHPGTEEQLGDLRGIRDRATAAYLASIWFYGSENLGKIESERQRDRECELEKDRRRIIRLARLAIEGSLGGTRDSRDNARSTAQQFLGSSNLEQLGYHELRDWEKMHRYTLRVTAGENIARPVLWRDRKRKLERDNELKDIETAIDAVPAGKPRSVQRELYTR